MTNPSSKQGEPELKVHALTVLVCQDCIDLKGEMCNNAECVFCRRTMAEVRHYLDVMLLCPIVDGKRLILVGDAVTNEDTRVPVASTAPGVDEGMFKEVLGAFVERAIWGHVASEHDHDWHNCGFAVCFDSRALIDRAQVAAALTIPGERLDDINNVRCQCGDLFSEHEKPPIGTPWDICSFPCSKCGCQEFTTAAPSAPKEVDSATPSMDAGLLSALILIELNDPSCQCEHEDENCCAIVGEFCARCWAHVAVRRNCALHPKEEEAPDAHEHVSGCVWERTTKTECEYRDTHHYCPHPEHACNCRVFNPTEEEAETILRGYGTNSKEVINGFIERLLKENLELKTKLAIAFPPAPLVSDCGGDGE